MTLCLGVALGAAALLLPAGASASDLSFCPAGSGAGQCASPRGVALDQETGRLYVADEGNNRIDVFAENGSFLFAYGWGVDTGASALQSCTTASTCQAGIAGSGSGQLDHPVGVAVDNDPLSPSHHDVYTVEKTNLRVQKFDSAGEFVWMVGKGVDKTVPGDLCTKASGHTCGAGANSKEEGGFTAEQTGSIFAGVGPGGVLYVLDSLRTGELEFEHRLQRFEGSGTPIPPQCILFKGGPAVNLAVEAGGGFWVASQVGGNGIRKYDAACSLLVGPLDTGIETAALALDGAGTLFAAQSELGNKPANSYRVLTSHNSAGAITKRFGYDRIPFANPPQGIAARSGGEGGVFVSLEGSGGIRRLGLPPPGPIAAPSSVEAKAVHAAKAGAVAEVNPEGKATEVHFEYLSQADYEKQGNSFAGAATRKTPTVSLGAEGFGLKAIEAQLGCPDPAKELAEGKCLEPATEYRFRVVATNPDGAGEGTAEGKPFTTPAAPEIGDTYATAVGTDTARLAADVNPQGLPTSGFFEYVEEADFQASGFANATKVPDSKAGEDPLDFGTGEESVTRSVSLYPLEPGVTYRYRIVAENPLVAPAHGEAKALRTFGPQEAESCPANESSRIGPGALLPDCRAYELVSPLDKEGGDIRVLQAPLGAPAVLEQAAESGERLAFGSARSFGGALSAPYTSQYIAQRIAGREWQTHSIDPPRGAPIFDSAKQRDTEFKAFSGDLCQAWLATYAEFSGEPPQGYFPGYSNLLGRSDRLCGPEGFEALAPQSKPTGASTESFEPFLLGVSADGRHAILSANGRLASGGSTAGQRQLYEAFATEEGTVALRFACILPGGGGVSGACTAGSGESPPNPRRTSLQGAISADGQSVFWSEAGTGEGKLYVRISGGEALKTVAVSAAAEAEAGTKGSWFWGAAADGSRAVFTTGGRLYRFSVAGKETELLAEGVLGVMGVSDDAQRIYFASSKALSGEEENSAGQKAVEGSPNLYLYDAGAKSTSFVATLASADLVHGVTKEALERTSRVSPSGASAAFASVASLTGYDNKGAQDGKATREIYLYDAAARQLICASCNPSGARPAGPASIPTFETGIHAARVLSDEGSRLYFDSADRLAARDTNGKVDVYQWERPGAGGCEEGDAGFSAAAGGCVELISSGQSPLDSRFVESDPSGANVFFATGSSLLPQDYGLVDIYDARVGGGLPVPPPPAPPCEGDACAPQIAAPEAKTPSSSTFTAPKAARGCARGKREVRSKGKVRCLARQKHRQRRRHQGRRAAR